MKKLLFVGYLLVSTSAILISLLWIRERFFPQNVTAPGDQIVSKEEVVQIKDIPTIYPLKKGKQWVHYYSPGWVVTHTKKLSSGDEIYSVNYDLDGAGYRNPEKLHQKKVPSHILLVGCSLVFGTGVQEKDTLRANLEKLLPDHAVYNLGYPGSGPHDHLWLYSNFPLQKYVQQEEGIMIFVYFLDHFNRANYEPSYLDWTQAIRPMYELDKNNDLTYKGNLGNHEIWKRFQAAKKLGLSKTLIEANVAVGGDIQRKVHHFSKVIKGLKDQYLKSFPKGKFYFLVMPHTYAVDEASKLVLADLMKMNVEIAPFEEMRKHITDDTPIIVRNGKPLTPYVINEYEGHPSGYANQRLAELIRWWLVRDGHVKSEIDNELIGKIKN